MPTPDSIIWRLAKTVYVVLYKTPNGKLTLLEDPGLNRPWSSHNKRLAEHHATENNGMAATWQDAWSLLTKEHGSLAKLEDDLANRIIEQQKAASIIKTRAN